MSIPLLEHDLPRAAPGPAAPAVPAAPPPPVPAAARPLWGVVAVAMVTILGLGFSPQVEVSSWTLRAAAVIVLAALAPPLLWRSLRGPQRHGAAAATTLLMIASVSAAVSPQPGLAVTGRYAQGTGLIFIVGLAGAWALGAAAASRRHRIGTILVLVAAINGAIGLLQATGLLDLPGTVLTDGRAPGLMGNPVQLAALLTGGLALVVGGALRRPAVAATVAFGLAMALQATGSRFGLGASVVIVIAGLIRHRSILGPLLGVAVVAGSLSGALLLADAPIGAGSAGSLERLVDGGSGVTVRLEHWSVAVSAVAERPLVGHGPGRFGAAVTPLRPESLATLMPTEQRFTDAHNLFVEYAVTTGMLGALALAAWLFLAGRMAAGPMAWFAFAVLSAHLLQPQMVGTTPLAFLALGAAGPGWRPLPGRRIVPKVASVALVVAGVVAAGALLIGDASLRDAGLDFTRTDAERADLLLPMWPEPAYTLAKIHLLAGLHDPAEADLGVAWLTEAASRDRMDPVWWNRLGEVLVTRRDYRGGQDAFGAALEADPYSVRAMLGMASVALATGDRAAATEWTDRAGSIHDIAPVAEMRLLIEERSG